VAEREQVNIRIDRSTLTVLRAAAFLDDTSVGELLRQEIVGIAERLEHRPDVKTALQARKETQATREGKLAPLRSQRRTKGRGNG
jgi:hypothetical protein